jgi:protein-disulfide isomerase
LAPDDAVKKAEAETRRLKEILDDPQKREQYLTEKAVKEFEDATPLSLDVSQTPFSGPANAPIQVVEFSDYLCPYCRGLAAAFKDYIPKSGGRVSIHYKNYPLDKACNTELQSTVHEGACWLALGALCSQQLGPFAAYQDKANTTPAKPMTRDDVLRIGGEAGIPSAAMGACLDAPATKARLAAEIDEARRVGVKATPTIFLNGKLLPRVGDFLLAVEKETRRLGLPPLPAPH